MNGTKHVHKSSIKDYAKVLGTGVLEEAQSITRYVGKSLSPQPNARLSRRKDKYADDVSLISSVDSE